MNYDEMPAGREMYLLVRINVIGDDRGGWHDKSTHDQRHGDHSCGRCTDWIPEYSTSISAAWEVVEKIRSMFPDYYIEITIFPKEDCVCTIFESAVGVIYHANEGAPTAPLAICRAALKAVEGEEKW